MLGWCPFYSLGVAAAVCSSSNAMCVDPDVWTLLSWLGYTTLGVVPVIWLTGDAQLRSHARRMLVPAACDSESGNSQVGFDRSSAGSVVSTQFTTVDRLPVATLK